MGLISGIVLLLASSLCFPRFLLEKRPKEMDFAIRLTEVQGWLGLVISAWGFLGILDSLFGVRWIVQQPVAWSTNFVANLFNLSLGFMLGLGLFREKLSSKLTKRASGRVEKMHVSFSARRTLYGFASLVASAWVIIYNFGLGRAFGI
jgi:hypothetical protein